MYVDADFGGDPRTRKSITGFVVRLFGCPVVWASHIQTCIAESSAEAENNAICDAVYKVLFLARLTNEVLEKSFFPITLYKIWLYNTAGCYICWFVRLYVFRVKNGRKVFQLQLVNMTRNSFLCPLLKLFCSVFGSMTRNLFPVVYPTCSLLL